MNNWLPLKGLIKALFLGGGLSGGVRLTSHKWWLDHPVEIHALVKLDHFPKDQGWKWWKQQPRLLLMEQPIKIGETKVQLVGCTTKKSLTTVRGCDKSNLFKRISFFRVITPQGTIYWHPTFQKKETHLPTHPRKHKHIMTVSMSTSVAGLHHMQNVNITQRSSFIKLGPSLSRWSACLRWMACRLIFKICPRLEIGHHERTSKKKNDAP